MEDPSKQTPIARAIELVGVARLAGAMSVSRRAVGKWEKAGRLPRTEWTGETNYSGVIEELTGRRVTREQLLAPWPRAEAAVVVNEASHAA